MEEDEIKDFLDDCPSLKFVHEHAHNPKYINSVITKLLADVEWTCSIAITRNYNLLACLYAILGDFINASEYCEKTLKINSKSIIARTNKVWMLLNQQKSFLAIETICAELKELKQHQEHVVLARSEVAYAYSRLGLKYSEKAVGKYKEVLEFAQTIQPSNTEAWNDAVCLWMFGLALLEQRRLHVCNYAGNEKNDFSKEKYREVTQLLFNVVKYKGDSQPVKRCKARSYVLIGGMVNNAIHNKSLFPNGAKDLFLKQDEVNSSNPSQYVKLALDICPDDGYVLERSGRLCRYVNDVDASIQHLRLAITVKETSFAYHHLALALKVRLEQRCWHHNRRGRGRGRVSDSGYQHRGTERFLSRGKTNEFYNSTGNSHFGFQRRINRGRAYRGAYHQQPSFSASFTNSDMDSVNNHMAGLNISPNSHMLGEEKCALQRSTTSDYSQHLPVNTSTSIRNNASTSSDQRKLKNMIKSPKKVKMIPKDKYKAQFCEIMDHLEVAYRLSLNPGALYDKGLLLRQVGQVQEAANVFVTMFVGKDHECSTMQLLNAYEQAAFCLDELISLCHDLEEKRQMEHDCRRYLKKSIQLSSLVIAKLPCLKNCWEGVPTYKSLLEMKAKTKDNLKELAFLYEQIESYGDAIDVLKELREISDGDDISVIQRQAEIYMKAKQYDDAIISLNLIRCLPNCTDMINKDMYVKAHIESTLEALKKGEQNIAKLNLLSVLTFEASESDIEIDQDDDGEMGYHVFILCDENVEEKWSHLYDVLEELGLSIAVNNNNVAAGKNALSGTSSVIENSRRHIVVLDSEKTPTGLFKTYICIIRSLSSGIVVIKGSADIPTPLTLEGLPCVEVDTSRLHVPNKWSDAYVCDTIKTLLLSLI